MNASSMSTLEVVLIIALVIGVIFSNLAVLKYSAKFKMPQFGDPNKKADSTADQQQDADKANAATDPEPREAQSEAGEKDESKK